MVLRTSSSRLKAKLGQYMRAVRAGKVVIVTDRDEPVARLVPYDRETMEAVTPDGAPILQARDPASPPLGDVPITPLRRYRGTPTSDLLDADRRRR